MANIDQDACQSYLNVLSCTAQSLKRVRFAFWRCHTIIYPSNNGGGNDDVHTSMDITRVTIHTHHVKSDHPLVIMKPIGAERPHPDDGCNSPRSWLPVVREYTDY